MKYDYMTQFVRLAKEEGELGKIRTNIVAEHLKNMPIEQGSMYQVRPLAPGIYDISARTVARDSVKLENDSRKLTININKENKKRLTSTFHSDSRKLDTTGYIFDEKGLYLFDGVPVDEQNQSLQFVVSFYDTEALNYILNYYDELLSRDIKEIQEKVRMGYARTELVEIKTAQDMLFGKTKMHNDILRNALLDQGISPDDEIVKDIEPNELIEYARNIYTIEDPAIFMLDNKEEMTM